MKISRSIVDPDLPLKLRNLPSKPGIYQFKDKHGKILYIGKAIKLKNRVRQYFSSRIDASSRIGVMVSKIADLEVIVTDSEIEALILEATLIKKIKPHYNIDLKDDKSYPYIVITKEPYPRMFVTRRVIRDGSRYFGPYTDVKNMRGALRSIRDIFRIRSCNYFIDEESIKNRKIKTCLDYHIKKCDGPCEGLISNDNYNRMINEAAQVLKGKTSTLINKLESEMQIASDNLRYEEAAAIRDKVRQLSVYNSHQKIIDTDLTDRDLFNVAVEKDNACGIVFNIREGKIVNKKHIYITNISETSESDLVEQFMENYYLDIEDYPEEILSPFEIPNKQTIEKWLLEKSNQKIKIIVPKIGDKIKLLNLCKSNAELLLSDWMTQKETRKEFLPSSVSALKNDLRLSSNPRRIECFDISNIQGADSVASMVVFINGQPKKTEYRKYKIKSVSGPDDYASMREVIERRYSRLGVNTKDLPDLIVIDGGKGQLSSAIEILSQIDLTKFDEGESHHIAIIGLAKRLEEIYFPGLKEPITIQRTSPGLRLLQRIRDEAHRFAITYHRSLRKKRTLRTELDLIQDVGKKRAKELLEVFGSVQGVKFASFEQLNDIVGFKVATSIQQYFDKEKTNS